MQLGVIKLPNAILIDLDKLENETEYRKEIQHRCYTDHYFLADVLGETLDPSYRGFIPRIHDDVVKRIYFPKNPNLTIPQQHAKKFRMHLDPRGTYKTTLGKVDLLQWVLAFPREATILTQSATQPIADGISCSLGAFFFRPKISKPSLLQQIFPDLVLTKSPSGEWNTPVRLTTLIDHTSSFTSPQTQQSGWHPWVDNVDDICDTNNSGIKASDNVRKNVIYTYDTNKYALRGGGFRFLKGTRYHPFELYGNLLDTMNPEEWEILIRSALIVKTGVKMLPGEFPKENEVILCFPELLGMDYKSLRQKFYDNYETFMCQMQNDPQGGHVSPFDEALYKTMLIPSDRVPALGDTYAFWRLPYGGKDFMQETAGAIARIYEGRVFILDAWQGNYTPSRLAEKIVRECKDHQAEIAMFEDLPGIGYMEGHIRNELTKRNHTLRMQWSEFEEDDNVRSQRIEQLEPQARAGKILISTECGKMAELKKQLLNFGIIRENGIVDCISRLAAKVPISLLRADLEDEELESHRRRRDEMMFHFVYGPDSAQGLADAESRKRREQEAHAQAMQRVNNTGLSPILGMLDG